MSKNPANPQLAEGTKKMWYEPEGQENRPKVINTSGKQISMEAAEGQEQLPEHVVDALGKIWQHGSVLREYLGTRRLSGNLPFRIIEDVVRALAEKTAARLWRQIKKRNPKLAVEILKERNRPKRKGYWRAQIVAGRKHRHIGNFKTRAEAETAYIREFERIWGYPVGYSMRSVPKLDKVWPTWEEEKARLDRMSVLSLKTRKALSTRSSFSLLSI